MDETPATEWEFLATDVTFEIKDDNARVGSGTDRPILCPGDLGKVEKSLARYCVDFIRREQARSQHSERASSALFAARDLCADRGKMRDTVNVERVVWEFFGSVRQASVGSARQKITAIVADLVGKLGATSAWLFRVSYTANESTAGGGGTLRAGELRLEVTHNARFEPVRLAFGNRDSENSLAALVAATGKPEVYSEIAFRGKYTVPKEFRPVKESTQSAVAVPVYADARENDLIGVLTLEFNRPAAVLPHHTATLTAEAWRLAPSLVVLRHAFEDVSDYKLVWDPDSNNWSVSEVLNAFCFHLATHVPRLSQSPGFGCTVWYADHERRSAFAEGAVRFDHEYLTQTLPTSDRKTGSPLSFIGSVVGHGTETYRRFLWRENQLFLRPDKAEQRELREIVAAPICRLVNRVDEESRPNMTLGALSLYFYSDEDNAGPERTSELFDEVTVRRICDVLARFRTRASAMAVAVADCLTRSKLITETSSTLQAFDSLRILATRFLDADACSVFVADYDTPTGQWPNKLQCVSSSGLAVDGVIPISVYQASYSCGPSREDLAKAVEGDKEFAPQRTLGCLINEDGRVRDNRMSSRKHMTQGEPHRSAFTSSRLIEGPVLDPNEDRRFLAVCVRSEDEPGCPGRPLGVIRVLRSARGRPFTAEDGDLLAKVGQAAMHLFSKPDSSIAFTRREKHAPAAPGGLETAFGVTRSNAHMADRSGSVDLRAEKARTRLQSPFGASGLWSDVRAKAVLRDILFALRPYSVTCVGLSTIAEHPPQLRQMELYAFDSFSMATSLLPMRAEPLQEITGSNRWEAAVRGHPIQFKGVGYGFVGVHPDQMSCVTTGFCFPFIMSFEGRPVVTVLSADFENASLFENEKIAREVLTVLFSASRKLSALACGAGDSTLPRTMRLTAMLNELFPATALAGLLHDPANTQKFERLTHLISPDVVDLRARIGGETLEDRRGVSPEWIIGQDEVSVSDWLKQPEGPLPDLTRVWQKLLDRSPVRPLEAETRPNRRAFGQTPIESADRFYMLRDLSIWLNFDSGRFLLPDPVFGAGLLSKGFVAGEFKKSYLDDHAKPPVPQETDPLYHVRQRFNLMADELIRYLISPSAAAPVERPDRCRPRVASG